MTGYTVHTGSTEKFSEGWDKIFGPSGKKPAPKAPVSASKAQKQKSAARKRNKGN